MKLYKEKGPDGVYKELRKIKNVGPKTASLMVLELERRFRLGLPTNLELTEEIKKGLWKLGLDPEDIEKELIPLIDVYGHLIKGGLHGEETENLLKEEYENCREIAMLLRKKLEESFD